MGDSEMEASSRWLFVCVHFLFSKSGQQLAQSSHKLLERLNLAAPVGLPAELAIDRARTSVQVGPGVHSRRAGGGGSESGHSKRPLMRQLAFRCKQL